MSLVQFLCMVVILYAHLTLELCLSLTAETYDMIRCSIGYLQELSDWLIASLIQHMEPKKPEKEWKYWNKKTDMLRRTSASQMSAEPVLRREKEYGGKDFWTCFYMSY